jgi:site-specific recombinase XerC
MQDLIQNYVNDLHKLREVFHKELEATAEELSKAMALNANAVMRHWRRSWRKLRLARASLNRLRRQGLVSSAVCRQTAV